MNPLLFRQAVASPGIGACCQPAAVSACADTAFCHPDMGHFRNLLWTHADEGGVAILGVTVVNARQPGRHNARIAVGLVTDTQGKS